MERTEASRTERNLTLNAGAARNKVRDRIKRTNPLLLRIRGIRTVEEWAERRIQGALFASEEEAVGHLLEAMATNCHRGASPPKYPDDFDYEIASVGTVEGYQVKLSWDCMPMSSRKNLSDDRGARIPVRAGRECVHWLFRTVLRQGENDAAAGQKHISLSSRELWTGVGGAMK
jgi:hypothetical protein